MAHLLTQGAVQQMMQGKAAGVQVQPMTVQVVQVKQLKMPPNPDRFKIILSDGQHFVQGMLSTQLNSLASNGTLQVNQLIKVHDYMPNNIQGKVIVILLNAEVLDIVTPTGKIGNPVAVTDVGGNRPVAPPSTAQPLYNSTNKTQGYGQQQQANKPTPMNTSPPSNGRHNPYGGASQSPSNNAYGGARGGGSAPIVRSAPTSSTMYTQIADLNLYQSRWTILASVTNKSQIRTWSNAKGEGSLFSVELLDNSGTDIRGTFFKEGVDRWYDYLVEGKTYSFSGGRLKVANAKYNNCKSQHEITFDQNSEIKLQEEAKIQASVFDFVENIAFIESMRIDPERYQTVDILAYVVSVGDVVTITSKKQGKELQKCDVVLVDDSNTQISMTMWGDGASNASSTIPVNEMVAIRRARLSEYNGGKSLSGPNSVTVARNDPSLMQSPAFGRLQQWYQQTGGQGARSLSNQGGGFGQPVSFSERKEIADIKKEQLGYQNEKGDYITFKANITFFKKDREGGAWYTACPNKEEPCKQRVKITQSASGMGDSWTCERCQGTYDHAIRRWIFSGVVEDQSGSTWVSFFNDQAEKLFDDVTADEIHKQYDGGASADAYESVFAKALYKEWIFKCKVKNEFHNDESRIKTSVQDIYPLDYVKESNDMLAAIAQF
mmetsp:Transcript_12392/g.34360  ORF Transcript_12392/g.34360 Transcript_12392/m.34360 type:complete len:661 (-) Transcript_12392:135-2117(-)|eukprot:CAMPEP_0168728592 /NCGR_PEP_ID=MMETSP0724-20121128/5764_1 /TAXON_ID=265536 /ORGANISM="Amphiprora sp., Strain CCMP467" /LENGTH=660 /DNA_ID=CAMNT_0008775443 /DNA_START=108 /DNA_END=2090 /DNA_ORIENTATION=-